MKTAPASALERTETGEYVGAVGGTGLSAEQKKSIRKVLNDAHGSPLMIGTIAARAQIPMNTPILQQQVSDFIGVYLTSTKEAEMHFEGGKTGREIFRGFCGTPHLAELLAKGLA